MTGLTAFFFRIFTGSVFAAAGLACFITLFYRCLVRIKHQPYKRRLILASFMTAVFPPFIAGYHLGLSIWTLVPGAFAAAFFVSSACLRLVFKKKHRADPPIAVINKRFAIGRPLTTFDFSMKHYQTTLSLSPIHSLRTAHLSDIHLHSKVPLEYYQTAIAATNSFNPDIVFITGDIMMEGGSISLIGDVLGLLRAKLGVFAVLGNHDVWFGVEKIAGALESAGIIHVGNSGKVVRTNDGSRLLVCGYEGPWNHAKINLPVQEESDTIFFLTHTPDNIFKLLEYGTAAVFAGHCHAGQIRLPWMGSLVTPSIYGKRFEHGHFMVGETHLFVSAGVGAGTPGFRLYCQPDAFIIDFKGLRTG